MKINELIGEFGIWTSNEEHELLETITGLKNFQSFEPRQQTLVTQLIRKSLLTKIESDGNTYVRRNR